MTGLPSAFQVRVHMLSDWIVGTGEGRVGDVDATVRRDGDGMPFVPAKTLTGVWRDACEQVAGWLGGTGTTYADNPWLAWVDWVFGSQPDRDGDLAARAHRAPRAAALALSPARLPDSLRAACRTRPALRNAAVIYRPGVAIDHWSGTARDDMLRVEERARPGVLTADADFSLADGELPAPAELLLRAGAAAVDSLGGKRNRGAGRCWILLPGMAASPQEQTAGEQPAPAAPLPAAPRPADERLAALAADNSLLDHPGSPPAARARPAARLAVPSAPGQVPAASSGAPVTYRVTMEVVTPVIAQQRVLGNVVMSLESVPGSILLPEILARLDGPASHRDLVVGDARPAIGPPQGSVPAWPAPMAWFQPKDQKDAVNAMVSRPGPAERRKPMRSGHVALAAPGTWHLVTPAMAVSAHAVIDDDEGRPTRDRGGVFSYLGLAPGTLLASDIVLPAGTVLRLAAGDRLRLGRSRKDDFGAVRVRDVRVVASQQVPGVTAGARVRVWCVSDVLLRDQWGAPDPTPQALAAELTRRLETPVTITVTAPEPDALTVQAAYRAARRESFHARWGRHRPSLTGLAAGSVVTVEITADVPGARLAAVQRDGIGERTAEGFGQIRFDPPELAVAVPRLVPALAPQPDHSGEELSGELPPCPDPLELAAVTAEFARRAAIRVADGIDNIVPGASTVSSRAQWGSLREQVGRLRTPAGLGVVHRWFEQSREVRQRRAIWGRPALDKLELILTGEQEIWAVLGLAGPALDPFVLAPSRASKVREELRLTAVATLIDEIARDATLALQDSQEER
jgi:CRISPR-associated protein Csx10